MTGDAEGEAEETEADGETDEFVASLDERAAGLDIDESAATVIEGKCGKCGRSDMETGCEWSVLSGWRRRIAR